MAMILDMQKAREARLAKRFLMQDDVVKILDDYERGGEVVRDLQGRWMLAQIENFWNQFGIRNLPRLE
jgi:hypothetical protein